MKQCEYTMCQCPALPDSGYCGDVCEWLDGGLLGDITLQSATPLKAQTGLAPRCACGHSSCADPNTQVGDAIH